MSRVPERRGEDLGQLGLAHAGLAFEQQGATQPQAEEDGGDEGAIGDVVALGERGLQAVDGLGVVGHMTTLARLRFAMVRSVTTRASHKGGTWPTTPRRPAQRPLTSPAAPQDPADRPSDAIVPYGGRLDEIAQDRFGRTDWIELAAAVLLALATIVAAWSAYQSTRWGGEQAKAYEGCAGSQDRRCPADDHLRRIRSGRRPTLDDVAAAASRREPASRADFIEERFRDEFTPAFDAWLALSPDGEPPPARPSIWRSTRPQREMMPNG